MKPVAYARPGQVLRHTYRPRGSAKQLFYERGAEVLVSGPAGTGKSRACMEKLHMAALTTPQMRGLIVRKVRDTLGSTALRTWREHVAAEAIEAGHVYFYGGSAEEPPQYRYPNGAAVMVGGMDKSIKIMSSEYDLIYAQEATELTLDDLEKITSRLRNGRMSFQQLIMDANPDAPTHWLKVRADSGVTTMLESRHEENPRLFDDSGAITPAGARYMAILDNLTGVRYWRLRKGLWVAAEGIIYEDWDPARHLIDAFPIPANWPRYWSVDFGFVNPFVCQMWAENPDGDLILYREIYHTRKTVDVHARDILSVVTEPGPGWRDWKPQEAYVGRVWTEPRPAAIITDHDAEGREVFAREIGMSTTAANKSVTNGIEAVQIRLKTGRLKIMKGALVIRDPELANVVKPTCTAEEFPGYVWLTRRVAGNPQTQDEPRKEDDHGMDTTRYIVAHKDLGARPRVRWL